MPKLREIISDLVGDLNAVNRDDRYSYRYLANKLRDKAQYFLKQDADLRKIFKMNDLWKTIDCIEFEDVDVLTCPWYLRDCSKIKKSKEKIPDTFETNYGNTIIITTLKGNKPLKQIKPFQYQEQVSNPFAKGKLFWFEDEHIFIPDSSIKFVKGYGIFKDTTKVDKFNGLDTCVSPLDSEFSFPDYIITIAKQEVLKELLGSNKQIIADNNADLNTTTKQ